MYTCDQLQHRPRWTQFTLAIRFHGAAFLGWIWFHADHDVVSALCILVVEVLPEILVWHLLAPPHKCLNRVVACIWVFNICQEYNLDVFQVEVLVCIHLPKLIQLGTQHHIKHSSTKHSSAKHNAISNTVGTEAVNAVRYWQ